MRRILILLSLGFILSATAEQFAVVQGEYVDLMSPQGELKYRLQRGEVVKVKKHNFDSGQYFVSVGAKSFTAPKNSFREVSSIFQEEKRLLSQIDKNHDNISLFEKELASLNDQKTLLNKKITELQIWIEVQRDLSYSREFFIQKTRGSFTELKKLKEKSAKLNTEIKSQLDKISTEKSLLKAFEHSFERLQTKLKSLKNERAFYQRNFVEVEVIASETPVFFNGRIVDYLNTNTKIKVTKARNLSGWYVFYKNKKAHFISSKDVMISQS